MPIVKHLVRFTLVGLVIFSHGCTTSWRGDTPEQRASADRSPPRSSVQPHLELAGMSGQDLLASLRNHFSLPRINTREIHHFEKWYRKHPESVEKILQRARWTLPFITQQVLERGYPGEIALLPAIESGYDPLARSPSDAAGLWQFLPGTAKLYGLRKNSWYDGRLDVVESTRAALDYLDTLQHTFRGDWPLALVAYNAGDGRIRKAVRYNRQRGMPSGFQYLKLPGETRLFVPKLLALRNVIESPGRFDSQLPIVSMAIPFASVKIRKQITHRKAAELCGIPIDIINHLNAANLQNITPPGAELYQLWLPRDHTAHCNRALAQWDGFPSQPNRNFHIVRTGETLSHIALRYELSLKTIKQLNGLGNDKLYPGQRLAVSVDAPASTSPGEVVHHVKRGDSLWHLARRYHVSARAIAQWNRIALNSTLSPGQQLLIYPR